MAKAGWALAIKSLPAFYGLGVIFILIRALPVEEYGQYGIAWAFLNVAAMCTRGLWAMTLVQRWASGRREQVLGAVLGLSLGTTGIGIIVGILLLPWLGLSSVQTGLTCVALLILVPRDLAIALGQAEEKMKRVFAIEVCYFLGSLIGFAALASAHSLSTAETALLVNTAAIVLSSIAGMWFYPQVVKPAFQNADYRGVMGYGKWTGVLAIGDVYFQQGDLLVLSVVQNPVAIAPYIAAKTFLRLFALASQAMTFLLYPMAARLAAQREYQKLLSKMKIALTGIVLLLLPACVALWFYADPLIPTLLGAKYMDSIPYVVALLPAALLEPLFSTGGNVLVGIGRPRLAAVAILAVIAVNVSCNLILVDRFDLHVAPWILAGSYMLLGLTLQWRVRSVLKRM
jgi:O-antigen/teichoic acid export membrane protein